MKESAPQIARRLLLAGGRGLEVLRIHQFEDDITAHDDELQATLERDFNEACIHVQAELAQEFGNPSRGGTEVTGVIPWNGIFRFAIWETEGKVLYLCAAHEDRELPYLLLLGTEPSQGK